MMNLHQLRIFCRVVEHGSYSKAAEILFMTQPAVSLQVHALERSLQVKLLERVNQQLQVTEAGQALYQCAIPMLNAESEAERVLAELKGAARGRLVVAANTRGAYRLRYAEEQGTVGMEGLNLPGDEIAWSRSYDCRSTGAGARWMAREHR